MDEDALTRGEVELSRQLQQHGARDIHVSQRLDQIDNSALQFDAGEHHLVFADPLCPKGSGKRIEHALTNVMRCVLVLGAPDCPARQQPDWMALRVACQIPPRSCPGWR